MNWGTREFVVINKEKIGPSTTDFRGDITIIKKKKSIIWYCIDCCGSRILSGKFILFIAVNNATAFGNRALMFIL